MRATGIVRRIDELGRIVIPKEIRKTLRIREGDPLEIYTDREGEIILKKYSPIGELNQFAQAYADSLSQTLGETVCITDKDSFIAVAGGHKELLMQPIGRELEEFIEERKIKIFVPGEKSYCKIIEKEDIHQVIAPIISDGDTVGAVIILGKSGHSAFGEVEEKIAQSAAGFLGNQLG